MLKENQVRKYYQRPPTKIVVVRKLEDKEGIVDLSNNLETQKFSYKFLILVTPAKGSY